MKTMKNKLFNSIQFSDYVKTHLHSIDSKVKALKNYNFENSTIDEITEKYYNEFNIVLPVLDIDGTTMSKTEDCKVASNWQRAYDKVNTVDGTRFTFYIPFTGDYKLFSTIPFKHSTGEIDGEVELKKIKIEYEISVEKVSEGTEQIKKDLKKNTGKIKTHLEYLEIETKRYNDNLKTIIKNALKKRKIKLDQDDDAANSLGFPIQ